MEKEERERWASDEVINWTARGDSMWLASASYEAALFNFNVYRSVHYGVVFHDRDTIGPSPPANGSHGASPSLSWTGGLSFFLL